MISQQENTDKDQDLQFLEAELAKLFIANQNETTEPEQPATLLVSNTQISMSVFYPEMTFDQPKSIISTLLLRILGSMKKYLGMKN
ncbi:hypothetical protein HV418_12110, partial [Enterococcus faecium]|nr:hypothetical protein [Enterococcus faecium]